FTKTMGTVTVIHDLQHIHLKQHFSLSKRLWLDKTMRYSANYASAVVAISDFVRNDILEALRPRMDENIVTIPNPVSWDRFGPTQTRTARNRPRTGKRTILTVASHFSHKNLATLLRAFSIVK